MVLEVKNLCKKIGKRQILKNVNLSLDKGDILAFVGPNGAGKTTTIKLILGLQSINSGEVLINGYSIEKNFEEAIDRVSAIVESPDAYMYLTGYQNLMLFARMYKGIKKTRIDEVVEIVEMTDRIHDKVKTYSLGMRQRLGIAISLLSNPDILIFDEPTNGLDPEGISDLRKLLKGLAKEGKSILISSHNLAELETFCNKVSFIKDGEIVETDSIEKVKQESGEEYRLDTSDNKRAAKLVGGTIDGDYVILNVTKKEVDGILDKLKKADINIYEISKATKSLEEVFIKKVGKK